ncbi:MAG: hypothetical protein ABI740_08295, partial [Alphaproteobacteria bacterium]
MSKENSVRVASLLAALALGACAHVAVLPENEPNHIGSVEVIQHDKGAPPAFAEALRQTVTREAAFYGDAGKGYDLKIDVDKVHFKNIVMAVVAGDSSHADGSVSLTDPVTGRPKSSDKFQVTAEPNAFSGVSIAELVIGMMDPTGIVSAVSTVGDASSAVFFKNGTAARMIDNFTDMALWRTF